MLIKNLLKLELNKWDEAFNWFVTANKLLHFQGLSRSNTLNEIDSRQWSKAMSLLVCPTPHYLADSYEFNHTFIFTKIGSDSVILTLDFIIQGQVKNLIGLDMDILEILYLWLFQIFSRLLELIPNGILSQIKYLKQVIDFKKWRTILVNFFI